MKKLIACALLSAGLASPVFASQYFVVVPVVGRTAPAAPVQVTLSGATLPAAKYGATYVGFDFKPYLAVSGDPNFFSSVVSWTLTAGGIPSGLALNSDGTLSGLTNDPPGTYNFSLSARYKGVSGTAAYSLAVQSAASATLAPGAGYSATFPDTAVNDFSNEMLVLKNTGNVPLTIQGVSGAAPFNIGRSRTTTVAPGAQANFSASFSPTTSGPFSGAVSVTTAEAGVQTLHVTGHAVI
ncbi:Ig-like domain-containing protein [Paraburkholderia sp. A3RO-2L]|uniref:Ig-like domain-containing protein n=1 Tax=unclassified Paraburkholderia TaxID=2615204 RepID=UPI0032FCEAC9|nr:putative Ig domain-containing protein [Burkholderia vietnamiensis]